MPKRDDEKRVAGWSLDQIGAYVDGELPLGELPQFEHDLKRDPELAREVRLHLLLGAKLNDAYRVSPCKAVSRTGIGDDADESPDALGGWSEEELGAYVDGALSPSRAKPLKEQLAGNPELSREIREREQLNLLLRQAYNEEVEEPESLPAWLEQQRELNRAAGRPAANSPWHAAVAAGLVALAIGIGGGYLLGQQRLEQRLAALEQSRAATLAEVRQTLNRVLEYTPSGERVSWNGDAGVSRVELVPVRTFKTADNRFCREFREIRRINGKQESWTGLACREGKEQWRTQAYYAKTGIQLAEMRF